jgi:dynein heavy chain
MENLLPTPQKSHYTFNLRDFSRVIQGVLLCRPSESFNKSAMVRLWTHESLRVFADRLVDDGDRKWFHEHIEKMCVSRFNIPFYDTFQHLDVEEIKEVSVDRMRGLLFGDFMSEGGGSSYEEIQSFNDLSVRMEECLAEFNQGNKKMDLVLFSFAIEHVARICRILRMPGGNSLLVGVGGSGRQSATR